MPNTPNENASPATEAQTVAPVPERFLNRKVSAPTVRRFLRNVGVAPQRFQILAEACSLYPGADQWRQGSRWLLRWSSVALLVASVVLFFAHFWLSLGQYGRFFSLIAAIGFCFGVAWYFREDDAIRRIAYSGVVAGLGVFVYTWQINYPTGSGAHVYLFWWALLSLPAVFISRFLFLWFFVLLVAEVGLYLFWLKALQVEPLADPGFALLIGVVNGGLIAAREAGARHVDWMRGRMLNRVMLLLTLAVMTSTLAYLYMIKDMPLTPVPLDAVMIALMAVFMAITVTAAYYYSHNDPDVLNLTTVMIALVAFGCILSVRLIYQFKLPQKLELLLLGLLVVAQVSAATGWLLRAAKREAV